MSSTQEVCRACGVAIPQGTADPSLTRVDIEHPHGDRGLYHARCYLRWKIRREGAKSLRSS